MYPTTPFLKALAAGGAILIALSLGACTEMDVSARLPKAELLRYSPPPELATPMAALEGAERYVREHPGSDFAIGRGDSMLPLYPDGAVLILERPPTYRLKAGQTVIFMASDGRPVAHVLVRHTSAGWQTQGLNNRCCDPDPLWNATYVGVVVKAYQPTASVVLHAVPSADYSDLAAR